jgi:hypothetical protein
MLVLFLPASAAAETWKNAPLVDAMCSTKAKPDPDSHTTKCALACAKGGFGILTADGAYLKFDEAGNREAAAALKNTKKENKLRATVTGERDGDTIKVQSLSLE